MSKSSISNVLLAALANGSPSAIEATTGAMRARTDVICFYSLHAATVRSLCGDHVASRWLRPLHCA
ncbi:MAG: hypothetical protein PHI57_07950, partial [Bacteroidales bacterium]|nr:hypothetical protein [Bacteroidales bacterium]